MTQQNRSCQNCKETFAVEPEDFVFYEKMNVPPPTCCPDCRQQQRILFRNFKTLYKSTSALSGKDIISMYAPDSPYTIYEHAEWWSDSWDAKQYGRDVDFTRPFFEQFQELFLAVPRFNLMNTKSENCLFSNMTAGSKNCYLVFGCIDDENCQYGHIVWNSKDCIDTLYTMKSELCYECTDCINCYKVFYSQDCDDCTDSIGLFNCQNCSNCIGCVGLSKKTYHLFNKPVSKDDYEEFLSAHPLSDPESIRKILSEQDKLRSTLPQRPFFGYRNEDVSGNHIYNAKSVHYSFDVKGGEDSKFIFTGRTAIDCYDCSFFPDCELGYQNVFCTGRMIGGSHLCINCNDVWYSDSCFSSNNLFGCVGLRNAQYCIFNKQYTAEEFEATKQLLIEQMKQNDEWGEFFPKTLSPFAYNESIVNEYIPLSKDDALHAGFTWKDDLPGTTGLETLTLNQMPTDPAAYSADLAKHIFACEECDKNYKLIPREIEFYRTYHLSLPRLCFNCRHMRRMNMRTPRKLWARQCICDRAEHGHRAEVAPELQQRRSEAGSNRCPTEFETTYAPDRPEIIYCEGCYKTESV